ncbi:hypothetical protein [Baekduia sp. Peel2402]|uniref:hypothetical protein n=1 Tax=Baekduia sp. Peel2402 TaxID=3458296 RepID=UPI00403EF175
MSRNVTWGLRAGFGLVALLLWAVIANGRASDAHDAQVLRWMEESESVVLAGTTPGGDRASVGLAHSIDHVESLAFALDLRCTPRRAQRLFIWFPGLRAEQPGDRDAAGVLHLRQRVADPHLRFRIKGTATVAVDARYDARHLTGTASARVTLADGTTCRSGDVPLRLTR